MQSRASVGLVRACDVPVCEISRLAKLPGDAGCGQPTPAHVTLAGLPAGVHVGGDAGCRQPGRARAADRDGGGGKLLERARARSPYRRLGTATFSMKMQPGIMYCVFYRS